MMTPIAHKVGLDVDSGGFTAPSEGSFFTDVSAQRVARARMRKRRKRLSHASQPPSVKRHTAEGAHPFAHSLLPQAPAPAAAPAKKDDGLDLLFMDFGEKAKVSHCSFYSTILLCCIFFVQFLFCLVSWDAVLYVMVQCNVLRFVFDAVLCTVLCIFPHAPGAGWTE